MRAIEYLSPTQLSLWLSNPKEYYLKYLAKNRPPRTQQTRPMSVGSAFDAFVKNSLYTTFHGPVPDTHEYSLATLLQKQVERNNDDDFNWAIVAGSRCMKQYTDSGALADLLLELKQGADHRMEFEVKGLVEGHVGKVPLLGRPDLSFHVDAFHVVYDWKVNGYCGASITSPAPGYLMVRDGWSDRPHSRTHRGMHKSVVPYYRGKLRLSNVLLEEADQKWATQLATYAWLLGHRVGDPNLIVGIDQLCGNPVGGVEMHPDVRIATHRSTISTAFQLTVIQQYMDLWQAIQEEHIFRDLPKSQSLQLQEELDAQCALFNTDDPDLQGLRWCAEAAREAGAGVW